MLVRLEGLLGFARSERVSAIVHSHGNSLLGSFTVVSMTAIRIRPLAP